MAIRPEYIRRRIGYGQFVANETGKAADFLESIVDHHLQAHAAEFSSSGVVRFPLAEGTQPDVLDDLLQRFRSVGWKVDRVVVDDLDALWFRME